MESAEQSNPSPSNSPRNSSADNKSVNSFKWQRYQHKYSAIDLQIKMTNYLTLSHIEKELVELLEYLIAELGEKKSKVKMKDSKNIAINMEIQLNKIKSLPVLYYAVTQNFKVMNQEENKTDWAQLYDWDLNQIEEQKNYVYENYEFVEPELVESVIQAEKVLWPAAVYLGIHTVETIVDNIVEFLKVDDQEDPVSAKFRKSMNSKTKTNALIEIFQGKNAKMKFKGIIPYIVKLGYWFDIIYATFYAESDEIFYSNEKREDLEILEMNLEIVKPKDSQKHMKKLEKSERDIQYFMSIAQKGFKHNSMSRIMISFMFYGAYYGLKRKTASKNGSIFMHTMDSNVLSKMVRFPDKPLIKKVMTLKLPKVGLSTKIYIPLNPDDSLNHESYLNTNLPKMASGTLEVPFKVKEGKNDPNTNVKIRIIATKDWGKVNWKKGKLKKPDSDPAVVDAIIIFIHGGGFCLGNTSMYQEMTRYISIKSEYPVFSLDYRLAPDYPHPIPLNDCWQAYLWIVYYAREQLQLKFDKIIMCGDSAGGNLILGITHLAIMTKCRIPDGLVPIYPGLSLDRTHFVPSMIDCLDDAMLNVALLDFFLHSYDSQNNASKDFLLSPSIIPDELLLKNGIPIFPPVRFVISDDPLRDECILYLIKLWKLGIDAKVIEYQDQMHGFLMFLKGPMSFKETKDGLDDWWKCIKELVGNGNDYNVII